MRGLFRRSAEQPSLVPQEATPAATPSPAVHASPGFAALFTAAPSVHLARILDLGPAVGENLAFYGRFARTVRFVDMLRDEIGGGPAARRNVASLLDGCLKAGDGPYDLVLAWDLLNYLEHDAGRDLIERLEGCTRVGTRLFAMISSGHTMPARPQRFTIVDAQRLAYRETGGGVCASPELAPAEVGRLLAPFRVERSVVLSHGVREYVAVRPRAAGEDDGEAG